MEYSVLRDGWIKIPTNDWLPGQGYNGSSNPNSSSFPRRRESSNSRKSNRLLLGLNQLLVKIGGKVVLVDCGLGAKWTEEQTTLLGYQQPRTMMSELQKTGVAPGDVDIVILTHLHFDHCGGATHRMEGSLLALSFTNALYYVQSRELHFARCAVADKSDDFKAEDFEPLVQQSRLVQLDGDTKISSGVTVHLAPGHTPGHQVVLFNEGDRTLFNPGDLFSTREHCNMTVVSAYEADRMQLLESRKKWLTAAVRERWQTFFCHTIRNPIGIIENNTGFRSSTE